MQNIEIARVFDKIADMLELKEENLFRVRAYRRASAGLAALGRELSDIAEEDPGAIEKIPGIGKDLAGKIKEMLDTGACSFYEELKKDFPEGFLELLDISGLGPKKLIKLRAKAGVEDIVSLEEACRKGLVESISGMGKKTQDKLLDSIDYFKSSRGRMLLPEADLLAGEIITYLMRSDLFIKAVSAGSLRRGKETVGDLDILAEVKDARKALRHFQGFRGVREVLSGGGTKSSVRLENGVQVDLRMIEAKCFGAALQYFTGSQQHNVELRGVARKKGYKLSEYGIFKKSRGDEWKYTAGVTEEDIYSSLGMQWIPPEMREGRGEIKSAIAGTIPHDLITGEDIKGDLHIHTDRTDGKASAEDIIQKCTEKGYKYFAVTDHSQHIRIANGMDGKSLLEHCGKLKRLASSCGRISLLTGVEVDILADGELDIEDDVLRELDLVVAAVHSRFSLNRARQTDRLLRAIDNKNVNILAHPSGRLITSRRGLDFDRERVFKAASEAGVALEINTHGQRIDLNDSDCIVARELGAKFAINTDAHSLDQLDMIKYGVITGRKAVLRKADVINTYELDRLLKFLIRS